MKLRHAPSSPFVRKVMVVAIETGLRHRIELVPTSVWDPATDIGEDNPLGKVPALITDDGEVLYDSPVICEYLDSMHDGPRLVPPSGAERWRALRRQALGDGMLDAAVARVVEGRRPPELRSRDWVARQKAVIGRALDVLEGEAARFGALTIGLVAIGCALGYLDFRHPGDGWRGGRDALAGWFATVSERPSFAETVLRDPA